MELRFFLNSKGTNYLIVLTKNIMVKLPENSKETYKVELISGDSNDLKVRSELLLEGI